MSSDFTLRLKDRLSAASRAMSRSLGELLKSEKAVTAAAATASAATTAAGNAMAAAGAKAAIGAKGFEKAAAAMRTAARSASFATLSGRGPGSLLAKGQLGAIAGQNRGGIAYKGGRKIFGRSVSRYGPVYDPSAQGAAAGGMGPILDRKAQGFSLMQRVGHGVEDSARGLSSWNSAAGETISKWQEMSAVFMRTPFGFVLSGLGKVAGVLFDVVSAVTSALLTVGKLVIAIGALAAISFTKSVVEMSAFGEASRLAFKQLTGSAGEGNAWYQNAVKQATDLGQSVTTTVDSFKMLRAAQFDLSQSTALHRMAADLATVTGHADAAERAIYAITKIKATGKLQGDELMILAEAGVSLDMVYSRLEKKLGKDRAGVLKAQQKGAISADVAIAAIQEAIGEKTHSASPGDAARAYSRKTLAGNWERLKNAPDRMFLRIGEKIDKGPLVEGLKTLTDFVDKAFSDGNAVRFVDAMVAGLAKLVPISIAFAEGFGSGLDAISKALSMGDAAGVADWARKAGKETAVFFERVIEVSKLAVPRIGEAIKGLFEGVNVNGILEDMKGFDWARLGSELTIIAKSLGDIVHNLAEIGTSSAVDAIRFLVGENENGDYKKRFGHEGGLTWDDLTKNFWGADEEPSAMPKVEPVVGPNANPGPLSAAFHITVNGGTGTPEELREAGKQMGEAAGKSLAGFLNGAAAEANA